MGVKIDVDRKYIGEFVEELKSGEYYLPTFQRTWVWDEKDLKDFIDSILKGYPVGVVILWRPSDVKKVDPFSKPIYGKYDERKAKYLILDGQQRLTALLLMFNGWKIERELADGEVDVVKVDPITYNPVDNKVRVGGKVGVDLSLILRALHAVDPDALRFLTDNYPNYVDAFKKLVEKIRNYRIPLYIVETENEDEETLKQMTDAFIRVNKEGVRIGTLELMLSYLGGYVGGDLSLKVRRIHNRLEKSVNLELQPLLRTVLSNLGIKMTDIKPDKFKNIVGKVGKVENLADVIERSEKAFDSVVQFLETLGIRDLSILPSQLTLVPIAKFFYENGVTDLSSLSDGELRDIEKWFVIANFRGYYSSQTDTKLQRDLELVSSSKFPITELLENMKKRRVKLTIDWTDIDKGLNTNILLRAGRNYLFLLYLLLVKEGADDWAGKVLRACKFSELDKHHIVPREFLRRKVEFENEDEEKRKINCLGNITFVNKTVNETIGESDPAEYLKKFDQEVLLKHFIPTDASLWEIKDIVDYSRFVEERGKLVYEAGKRYYDFFSDD